jgi:hypothetical protein
MIAMECDVAPGDWIYSPKWGLYFILGEEPHDDLISYSKVLIVSKNGHIFRCEVPRNRSDRYPFILDGVYIDMGDEKRPNDPI